VSVIDTVMNAVTATIPVGTAPVGIAVSPDSNKVYVANNNSGTMLVIDAATNAVHVTIPVGSSPYGVSVTPDGSKVYVANIGPSTVSVIDTATSTVAATIPGFNAPIAFGVFIQPPKPASKFAGTPGKANCHGQSVSVLVKQYGGLNNAAVALGYASADALQQAIQEFCAA